jgi:hypothetical protein
MTAPHIKAVLIPWADAAFVEAFERARDQAIVEGMAMPGPEAASRVQRLLRTGGYPRATVDVEATVDEALVHYARWTVRRDGR